LSKRRTGRGKEEIKKRKGREIRGKKGKRKEKSIRGSIKRIGFRFCPEVMSTGRLF